MILPFWLALGAGSVLLVPASIYFAECVSASLGGALPTQPLGRRPRLCVLVPAHNEAEGIRKTIEDIKPQLLEHDRLMVVADNCSDTTAAVAKSAGALVLERFNEEQRGKGFAISFGLEHLDTDPPEVLVLVDADCTLSEDAIDIISRLALSEERPIQAEYLLTAPKNPSTLALISSLAFLIRNHVRPLGLAKLGFPCHLTGSGMAFAWPLIRNSPALGDNLVEDLVMGLDMAVEGHSPMFCPAASVRSLLPEGKQAATSQRTRWEHGQLATLASRGPRLLRESIRQKRPELAAIAADLMVPPLALLVASLSGATVAGAVVGVLARRPLLALLPPVAGLGLVGLGTLAAWTKFARHKVPAKTLLMAPLYVSWKLPMYVSLLVRGRQRSWVRTERAAAEPSAPLTTRSGAPPANGAGAPQHA